MLKNMMKSANLNTFLKVFSNCYIICSFQKRTTYFYHHRSILICTFRKPKLETCILMVAIKRVIQNRQLWEEDWVLEPKLATKIFASDPAIKILSNKSTI